MTAAAATLVAAASATGCVDIDGGAVEVSWAIFARDGRAITECACAQPALASVRLNLISEDDGGSQPCAGVDACRFSCARKTGATPFFIPPGRYLMSVVPVDASGDDLPTGPSAQQIQAPPAESRSVVRGQPTELEAFTLEADCSARCDKGIFEPCSSG